MRHIHTLLLIRSLTLTHDVPLPCSGVVPSRGAATRLPWRFIQMATTTKYAATASNPTTITFT